MQATTLDGIARDLRKASTRRSIFRRAGSLAIAASVAASGLSSASAAGHGQKKHKQKCRPGCNSESRCVHGTCVPIDRGTQESEVAVERRRRRQSHRKRKQDTRPADTSFALPNLLCTQWILSGGVELTTIITGANDLQVTTRPLTEGTGFGSIGKDRVEGTHNPVLFDAHVGDRQYFYVDNYHCTCEHPSLWLHCPALGVGREFSGWSTLIDLSSGCPETVTFEHDEWIRV
ncbi:MAG: hypothetical protein U0075_26280 [Thermomicrobiales bacterium]